VLEIDGSQGEGGGQILRSSLALSLVTGRAFRISRIRAGRPKPGLAPQHLTAVRAAAEVGKAEVKGAALGSQELTFTPGEVSPGDHRFDVGTAGSATLVLQTVLPPLLCASRPSRIVLIGGTHNMQAPPFDFLARTFTPVLNRLGPRVELKLIRPGFYPVGGGEMVAMITPGAEWRKLDLSERGPARGRRARAVVSRLPAEIGRRELRVVEHELGWPAESLVVEEVHDARGPGNVLLIELNFENIAEVVAGFGARGVRAEVVAAHAVQQIRTYLASDAPVGEHLADQLLLPLAIGAGGYFRAINLSRHAATNIEVMRRFLDVRIDAAAEAGGAWRFEVAGKRAAGTQPA
jgi:RNA 3'-terminal phosphate cyclase (ATP)